jgi:hypothetical protein
MVTSELSYTDWLHGKFQYWKWRNMMARKTAAQEEQEYEYYAAFGKRPPKLSKKQRDGIRQAMQEWRERLAAKKNSNIGNGGNK